MTPCLLPKAGITYESRKLWFQEWYETAAAYNTLKKGPQIQISTGELIRREDIIKKIKPLITPNSSRQGYGLIIGEQGTGKTHLVQQILRDMKKPRGVVYIDFLQGKRHSPVPLTQLMGRALNLKLVPNNCKHSFNVGISYS
jgi:hypothetical protein